MAGVGIPPEAGAAEPLWNGPWLGVFVAVGDVPLVTPFAGAETNASVAGSEGAE
jgi:hypothetical protein